MTNLEIAHQIVKDYVWRGELPEGYLTSLVENKIEEALDAKDILCEEKNAELERLRKSDKEYFDLINQWIAENKSLEDEIYRLKERIEAHKSIHSDDSQSIKELQDSLEVCVKALNEIKAQPKFLRIDKIDLDSEVYKTIKFIDSIVHSVLAHPLIVKFVGERKL